jgi:hypothetical protein
MPILVNPRWLAVYAFFALGGCAVQVHGLVEPVAAGAGLLLPDGTRLRLISIEADGVDLAALDGYLATFEGQRVFRTLRVSDWSVHEGTHGLTAWVGELRWMGTRMGIQDRNSGSFYILNQAAAEVLHDLEGEVVLVEGYVDGPNEVHVLYWLSLHPARAPAAR